MEYRDYGSFQKSNSNEIISTDLQYSKVDTIHRGQVYRATHEGEKLLPFMNRSFISFSFGGKNIEEFNLIATINDNRLSRNGYANFEDKTTTYDVSEGQQYWGTHYRNNSIEFTLSTDGMDQRQLDDFLYWFSAGYTRELVLAEHPNRGILARVSDVPTLDLLPFETQVSLVIDYNTYHTSTTLYKGSIHLSLIMDEPYWYSLKNILGVVNSTDNRYDEKWADANNDTVWILESKDALKILYEDGIPINSMIRNNMLFGNGAYANIEGDTSKRIWSVNEPAGIVYPSISNGILTPGNEIYEQFVINGNGGTGARISGTKDGETYQVGFIAGAIVEANGDGISDFTADKTAYFYYAGTAPSPVLISFELLPQINTATGYVVVPYNSHTQTHYNTITITSKESQQLCFTTPNLLTSYNKAVEIFSIEGMNIVQARALIRDNVRHAAVRAWANKVLDYANTNSITFSTVVNGAKALITYLSYFLTSPSDGTYQSIAFEFNSKTGEAYGTMSYRVPTNDIPEADGWASYGTLETKKENVGDMLLTNHLIIRERNYPNSDGQIVSWNNSTEIEKGYSHCIKHNVGAGIVNYPGLQKFMLIYKNMYL